MGKFISEDTYEGDIKNPLGLNLYTYVENNPLTYIDPSGNSRSLKQKQDPGGLPGSSGSGANTYESKSINIQAFINNLVKDIVEFFKGKIKGTGKANQGLRNQIADFMNGTKLEKHFRDCGDDFGFKEVDEYIDI